ncbi:MAG: hypothetical protein U0T81_09480 [Saprospiraceae bacterium]
MTFVNKLDPGNLPNPLEYINVFNGGGVILVDINNDNLTDILLTGNRVGNKLYLKQGGLFLMTLPKARASANIKAGLPGELLPISIMMVTEIFIFANHFLKVMTQNSVKILILNNGNNTFTDKAKNMV